MKEYLSIGPTPLLTPVPVVMVSCKGKEGKANIITVAWAGTVCSKPPMVSISLRKERYSYELISSTKEFVINMVTTSLAKATDFCGVKSGKEIDKFTHLGLTPTYAEEMTYAPGILESPIQLTCRVKEIIPLGSHDLFLAEIKGVYVKESLTMKDGGFALHDAQLVAYNHGVYQQLGEVLGLFGYSIAGEKVYKKRMSRYKADPSLEIDEVNDTTGKVAF